MALYERDRAQLSDGADKLTALILGDRHRRKQMEQAQGYDVSNADQKAEHELAKLVRGEELNRESTEANMRMAVEQAKAQGMPAGRFSISASQQGFGINPEPQKDPLELLLRKATLDQVRQDKDDKMVQQLSKRVEDAKIGPSQAALQNLGASVQEKGVAVGPYSANLPVWMVSAGEQLGLADPGATEQRQSIDALMAFQRNPLFGASLTPGEQQSFNNAFGMVTAGTPEQRKAAIGTLEALYNKAVANVGAGSPERIRQQYQRQGGIPLGQSNVLGKGGGMDPARKARLEALRAKARGGN